MPNLPIGDIVNLVRREELAGLLGRDLSRFEWTTAKRMIMRDKDLWAHIDSTLMLIVDEIGKQKI